ncbi:MAG: hypothetical protein JWN69_1431 [Alphaproteobacteria bacterium]|nr:hypothetical protein [Alphaproteobacteria bacterium]
MTKPPPATPHSDIDGVHQDERRNTDVAADLGQSAGDVEHAKKASRARPPLSDDQDSRDDRS